MIKKVTITPKFSALEIMRDTLYRDIERLKTATKVLGSSTHQYMINYINNNVKRGKVGTGNLASNITYEDFETPFCYGFYIGDINVLDSNAKYWAVVNWGGYVPNYGNPILGSFWGDPPDSSRNDQSFITDGQFLMTPKKPIRPMNYIEATQAFLRTNFDTVINRI